MYQRVNDPVRARRSRRFVSYRVAARPPCRSDPCTHRAADPDRSDRLGSKYRTPRRPATVCFTRVKRVNTARAAARNVVQEYYHKTNITILIIVIAVIAGCTISYNNEIVAVGIRPTGSITRFILWSGIIYYYNIKWPNSVQ